MLSMRRRRNGLKCCRLNDNFFIRIYISGPLYDRSRVKRGNIPSFHPECFNLMAEEIRSDSNRIGELKTNEKIQ